VVRGAVPALRQNSRMRDPTTGPGRATRGASDIRTNLAAAAALNSVIFLSEAWAGLRANSLSLLMDAAHNLSDELALVCLFLAHVVARRMSRGLQRTANLLNGAGLIVLSAAVCWKAVERMLNPSPVLGWMPAAVGLFGVVGNWGVARLLKPWASCSATIRLAYVHNVGDVVVSLMPVVAGGLVLLTGLAVFDPVIAFGVGVWLMATTARELRRSADELIWPEEAGCLPPKRAGDASASD